MRHLSSSKIGRPVATPKKLAQTSTNITKSASTHKASKPSQAFLTQKQDKTFVKVPEHNLQAKALFSPGQGELVPDQKASTFKFQIKQILKQVASGKVENSHVLKNLEHSRLRLKEAKQSSFRELNRRISEIMAQDEESLSSRIERVTDNLRGLQQVELEIDLLFQSLSVKEQDVKALNAKVQSLLPAKGLLDNQVLTPDLVVVSRSEIERHASENRRVEQQLKVVERQLQNYRRLYQNQMSLRSLSRINQVDIYNERQRQEELREVLQKNHNKVIAMLRELYSELTRGEDEGIGLEDCRLIQSIKQLSLDRIAYLQRCLDDMRARRHDQNLNDLAREKKIDGAVRVQKLRMSEEIATLQAIVKQQKETIYRLEQERRHPISKDVRTQARVKQLEEELQRLKGGRPMQPIFQALRQDYERTRSQLIQKYEYQLSQQDCELRRLRALQKSVFESRQRKKQNHISYAKCLKEMSDRLMLQPENQPESLVESIRLNNSFYCQGVAKAVATESDHMLFSQFDYRVCPRCKKNDLISPGFCQFLDGERRRVERTHLFAQMVLQPAQGKVRHVEAGVEQGANTIIKLQDFQDYN